MFVFILVWPGYPVKSPVSTNNDEKSRSTGDAARKDIGSGIIKKNALVILAESAHSAVEHQQLNKK